MKLSLRKYLYVLYAKWARPLFGVFVVWAAVLSAGCTTYNLDTDRPTLYTTISADGQMVAALSNIGGNKVKLRVIRLDDNQGWQSLQAPARTTSIRFGLQGHQLLLTRDTRDGEASELSSWDMDAPESGRKELYTGSGLVFPIETSPGEYLVRGCIPNSENHCHRAVGVVWNLVKDGQLIKRYTAPYALNYSQPSVVQGKGFFWRAYRVRNDSTNTPSVISFAFPDGVAPTFDMDSLGEDTTDIECDYGANRCLRSYIQNWGKKAPGDFLYDTGVLLHGKRCEPEGTSGWSDGVSLTPDGSAAVKSLAQSWQGVRHVLVMHFASQQCDPTSVLHINLPPM